MPLLTVDPLQPEPVVLEPAAKALREGQLVAFPTETVYGLGANALDEEAVRSIFRAKGRPQTNPLIVHVSSWEMVHALVLEFGPVAQKLADAFWPGPLTIICPKSSLVSDLVTAGLPDVALRWPAHPVAQSLLQLANVPVAAPSANRYTHISPTQASHVVASLGERVVWVVDGGASIVGLESTVVSVDADDVTILRPGMIDQTALEHVVGQVHLLDPSTVVDDTAARSPGLARKHYAPEAPVSLVLAKDWVPPQGKTVALIERGSARASVLQPWGIHVVLPDDPKGYAHGLYWALHQADAHDVTHVYIVPPPRTEAWYAIWNRLERAVS